MQLKFDANLAYQQDAIAAVVDLFDGQPMAQAKLELNATGEGLMLSELGVGNRLALTDAQLLANVHKVQAANNLPAARALAADERGYTRHFSLEMETGTGKTYVYLRSIFELSKRYGLKKFIIVVPSVAVREGVLKSIQILKSHLRALYDNQPFDYFIYASSKLGRVRQFASSNQIQIMVLNIQSFQRDVGARGDTAALSAAELKKLNIIHRENDKMSGRKPIEFIQAARPVVLIDEPQSVDNTAKAQHALATLTPLVTLRYSATHRQAYNLLYKLDAVRAYDLRLVKRIEVLSVLADNDFNAAYVKLLKTDNTKGIKAQVEIHKHTAARVKPAKLWVKPGDDLFAKSGQRPLYQSGYIVRNIDCTPQSQSIELSNGTTLRLGQACGSASDAIQRAQIYACVEQHLKKELYMQGQRAQGRAIKVLSLLFIDRVANYRVYTDGAPALGKLGQWFEQAYQELTAQPRYKDFATDDIAAIHNGYFSQDRRGQWKDSAGGTKDDEATYNLIMRDKERLLDVQTPLRFIFSHSALREGWDNPNVFQICTLNASTSGEKKRQEIGRGLRLPVNQVGERVHDPSVNRLTVIANESYEAFAKALQTELEQDCGIEFGRIQADAFAAIVREVNGEQAPLGAAESQHLYQQLINAGYIDAHGKLLPKFDPQRPQFVLSLDPCYADIAAAIIDQMQRYVFSNRVVNASKRRTLHFKKPVYLSPEFSALWDKIKWRTRYRVHFDTAELVAAAVARLKALAPIAPVQIARTRVAVAIDPTGVTAAAQLESGQRDYAIPHLPDLLAYLQQGTELTRSTLVQILRQSGKLDQFRANPQAFMALSAREITYALRELILQGIQYEKVDDHYWEMRRIKTEGKS